MQTFIVGLSGKCHSGKDTAAELIQKLMPEERWIPLSFAYRLKVMVAALTGTTIEQNLSIEGKEYVPPGFSDSLGALQQKLGVALRESIDPNIWVNIALAEANNYNRVIITDVRFPNEFVRIKERGGIIIRIEGDPAGKRACSKRDMNHISETALDNGFQFDAVIHNNGSKEEFAKALLEVIKEFI